MWPTKAIGLLLWILFSPGIAQHILDLSPTAWTLHSENGSISVPAKVPSIQYLDLLAAGIIADPLFGQNNEFQADIMYQNWTYSSGAIAGLSSDANTTTFLVFQGLDTWTQISLCSQQVGNTDNQFRQWIFDVSSILAACGSEPQLLLNFGSAVNITNAISASPGADGIVNYANGCTGSNDLGCKAVARKEQSDFGWDWAPALVPAGPWKPIYAVQLAPQEIYVNNALIDIFREGQRNNLPPDQSQPWTFNASIDFVGTLPPSAGLHLTLSDASGHAVLSQALNGVYSSNNTITGSSIIDPALVQTWWPNGLGAQPLYNATVTVVADSAAIATVERRVGFRTVVLNLGPITDEQLSQGVAPGSNWHFEVNGQEFYAKGSNFVPPDVFWPRVNASKITTLFSLAKDANMNLLRVWASGAYLDDWVYDLADEMGIFLWSEFEFTDAEYPNTTSYLANYEAEAYYNVRRVNHHPSLALWAGGNELEAIQLAYFFNPDSPTEAMAQYQQVFEELLIKCVYANTRSISYIPSSTYNGYLSLDFDSVRPQTPRYKNTSGPGYYYADTDAYNDNVSTMFDLNSYPVGRFADEFGFISFPSALSFAEELPEDQRYATSPDVVDHNRHVPFGTSGTPAQGRLAGINEMLEAVQLYLPTPQAVDPVANFSAWTWSTQVVQADNYAREIAFYRRGSGMPERQLGCLYWMFNDLWDGSTWASVEYNNRPKILYYAVRDIYTPVIVSAYFNSSTTDLSVWVTSDLLTTVSGTLTYTWIDWAGNALALASNESASGNLQFSVGALNASQTLHYPSLSALLPDSPALADALLVLTIQTTAGATHRSIFHVPTAPATIALPDPGLVLAALPASAGTSRTFNITATRAVAAWVWLEVGTLAVSGAFDENGFWLLPRESRTVTFRVDEDWSGGGWVEEVTVRSLWNNTLA